MSDELPTYTRQEMLHNSVKDVALSWLIVAAIGIALDLFLFRGLYLQPYLWAAASIWLWRAKSVAAAKWLLRLAVLEFAVALWGKFLSPTLSLGVMWSAILLAAAFHGYRKVVAIASDGSVEAPDATSNNKLQRERGVASESADG